MERHGSPAPAVAELRVAVRRSLQELLASASPHDDPLVVVALSGGADSLALTAATAFEAPRLGIGVLAVTVDHGLQDDSAAVAEAAAAAAAQQGCRALVRRVVVEDTGDGIEAAARAARYEALTAVAVEHDALAVLLGHTLDDQAETVLLGLSRGAGATSLSGMPPRRPLAQTGPAARIALLRPLLGSRRETLRAACDAEGLVPWDDPHNLDPAYARVRVRTRVLPLLEDELGPGVAESLARTADQLREDAAAFQEMIDETIEDIVEHAEAGISVSVAALAANPAALRHRILRHVVASEFHVSLTRVQTLEVARLVTDWTGQGPLDLPGCTARRHGGRIEFAARA